MLFRSTPALGARTVKIYGSCVDISEVKAPPHPYQDAQKMSDEPGCSLRLTE